MKKLIETLVSTMHLPEVYERITVVGLMALIIAIIALLTNYIAKKILNDYSKKIAEKTTTKIDDILIEKGVFNLLAHIAPALVIYGMLPMTGYRDDTLEKILISYVVIIIIMAIFRIMDAFVDSMKTRSKAKAGPLKGIVQVLKIALGILAGLIIVITFMGNDRGWAIFSSIGGLSAVLLLIFRDSILGFVAGVQLSAEGLLKLGDWLEMPKFDADGEVVDISLTKVTVRNWDKTYTAIPAYKFLEESFKNWQGMTESGGRRIKRAISMDMNTIRFLTEDEWKAMEEIDVLKPYLKGKKEALTAHNKEARGHHIANQRKLTNIGTFRAYVEAYLRNHENIHQGLTLLVRQLAPGETGVPIEIYCFTSDTAWANYEAIQADIFDHLYAIMPSFGLKPFQQISGTDLTERR